MAEEKSQLTRDQRWRQKPEAQEYLRVSKRRRRQADSIREQLAAGNVATASLREQGDVEPLLVAFPECVAKVIEVKGRWRVLLQRQDEAE